MRWNQVFPASGSGSEDIPGGGLQIGGLVAAQKGLCAKQLFSYVSIQPGYSSQQRCGQKISPKSFIVKLQVMATAYDGTANPFHQPFTCHVLFYKNKTGQAAEGDPSTLLESFSSNTQALSGSAYDSMAPWNRANYVIKKYAKFKLKPPPAPHEVVTTTGDDVVMYNPSFGSANTPVFVTKSFKIPIAKTWYFSDGGLNVPRNDYLSLGIWTTQADGQPILATQTRAKVICTARLYYTDM